MNQKIPNQQIPDSEESKGKNGVERPRVSRAQAIINPAAGKDTLILKTLNAAFKTGEIDWDVSITKKSGDGTRLTKEALEAGAELIVVHGGDGTVMEVASGLIGSEIPMAIIPGGTANVVAHELGIPLDVMEATILAINREASIRKVDMGKIGQHHFLIRAGMGFEAAMIEGADRESKDRFGLLAYALSALQELADPEIARYQMVLDGQNVEAEGLACIIANSGNIGRPRISIQPSIHVSDGRLDVVVITRSDLPSLVALAASIVGGAQNLPALQHWQVKEARIASNPRQKVQVDGEILYETPIEVTVVPQAVSIITPPVVSPD